MITIKKLEISFIIVYFLATLCCFLVFKNSRFIVGSLAGFLVSFGDWFLLKFMAKKWLNKGRYSFVDSIIRFVVVGISIYFLLSLNINRLGIVMGVSIIPLTLMIFAMYLFIFKRKIIV